MPTSSSSQSVTLNKPTMQIVYELAKSRDDTALSQLVANGVCLTEYQGTTNVMTLLGLENDIDTIDFLNKYFDCGLSQALFGAALGGHVASVNQLLHRDAPPYYAVMGYAKGGYKRLVNDFLAQSSNYCTPAAFGYAWGNDVAAVDDLVAKGANVVEVVLGYGFGGNEEQINKLKPRIFSSADIMSHQGLARCNYDSLVDKNLNEGYNTAYAVQGYAAAGNSDKVNSLIAMQPNTARNAIIGYAIGGHVQKVNRLLKRDDIDNALVGYGVGGHIKQVEELLNTYPDHMASAIQAFARAGLIEKIEALYKNSVEKSVLIVELKKGLEISGYYNTREIMLRTLCRVENDELREILYVHAFYVCRQSLDYTLHRDLVKIKTVMKKNHFNFDQACAVLCDSRLKTWLWHGDQIVKEQLPAEIFFRISALLLEISPQDAYVVFKAMHEKLFCDTTSALSARFKQGLFTSAEFVEKQQVVTENFHRRSVFY